MRIHLVLRNMYKVLNVAEKNDAAKNIAGVMSNGSNGKREGYSKFNKIYEFPYRLNNDNVKMIMTSVSGHLLSKEFIAGYKHWEGCDPVELFEAKISQYCKDDYMPIKNTIEREVKGCKKLIIWTDCDREGEGIGQEIIDVCLKINPRIDIYRAIFSEITKPSIMRAINNLARPNKNISDAVEARSELDLRIGAAFTRFQTMRLRKVFPNLANNLLSYGSCQFPTLGFVVERYKSRENFQSEPFWKIVVKHLHNDRVIDFVWERVRLFDYDACNAFYNHIVSDPTAHVQDIKTKPKSKWRPTPLDTIELEKSASRKLKINAKETMKIAENLYTKGFISYPRTETNIFPKDFDLQLLIQHQTNDPQWGDFATGILQRQNGPTPRNGVKSDQAHPPIHPTKYTDSLSGNDKLVYEFIVRHFLATCQSDARGFETTVTINIKDEKFTTSGLMITERNYLDVYKYDKWSDKEVPVYKAGDEFTPESIDLTEGQTEAPQLLTEADLIALMEKHGIGTDATHAEHIETIKDRSYVYFEQNRFIPAEIGLGLVEGYDSMGYEMSKPLLRAALEDDLKKICDGVKTKEVVLKDQVQAYKRVFEDAVINVEKLDEAMGKYTNQRAIPFVESGGYGGNKVLDCSCKAVICLKKKKDNVGFFLSCRGFPDCKISAWLPSSVLDAKVSNENCESCHPKEVKKISFKFDKKQVPFTLPTNYTTCVLCDVQLREAINFDVSKILSGTSSTNNSVSETPRNPSRSNQNVSPHFQSRSANNSSQSTNMSNSSRNYHTPSVSRTPNSSNTNQQNRVFANNITNQSTNNSDDLNPTVCYCGRPARLLTVRKEGPNLGRQFYVCPDDKVCDFFSWADADENSSGTGGNSGGSGGGSSGGFGGGNNEYEQRKVNTFNNNRPSNTQNYSNPNGSKTCECQKPAILLTVRKEGPNQGRKFYKCPEQGGCNFFEWDDDTQNSVSQPSARSQMPSSNSPFDIKKKARAKPKCSNCRQEGHRATHCPNV